MPKIPDELREPLEEVALELSRLGFTPGETMHLPGQLRVEAYFLDGVLHHVDARHYRGDGPELSWDDPPGG